jgi:predicted component of type VI protein secretion system
LALLDALLAPSEPEPGPASLADPELALLDDLLSPPEPAQEPAPQADPGLAFPDALLAPAEPDPAPQADPGLAFLDALLAPAEPDPEPAPQADPDLAFLDALLAPAEPEPAPQADPGLALLDDLLAPAEPAQEPAPQADPDLAFLDALLAPVEPEPAPQADAGLAFLDALLAPAEPAADREPPGASALDVLDDLLAGDPVVPTLIPEPQPPEEDDDPLAALEALLAGPPELAPAPEPAPARAQNPAADGLDDLLALLAEPLAPTDGMDDLLAGLADLPAPAARAPLVSGFGRLQAAALTPEQLVRPVFRMAILGDFSGRAARGQVDVGVTLARRPPVVLDPDTLDEIIDGFATTLVLPVGEEAGGIEVPLRGIDSLHPDEIVANVPLFDGLRGLRQRLSNPRTSAAAVAEMAAWGGRFQTVAHAAQSRSAAAAVPADMKLSDFDRLLAADRPPPPTAAPAEALIARIVGPHIQPGPAPEAAALIAEVDRAMGESLRLILHHPEFQAVEQTWRTLDFLCRRIATGAKFEMVLYDVSAQELAADMATNADLSRTGLFGILNAPLAEPGGIGFSAVIGLHVFEETPPHAELVGRIGQVAGHFQAPFFAAMSPKFLETAKATRHPLVAQAWDTLAADPVSSWVGLAAPRFLLRRPYGKRTEPIDAFAFEEFTLAEGLSGMLWGNPAALVAVLLGLGWKKDGVKMSLGTVMSVGEMPYHHITDPHGDQVALPCTERLISTEKSYDMIARGLIPVLSIKGRDVVRLGNLQSLAGSEILGRWTGVLPERTRPEDAGAAAAAQSAAEQPSLEDLDALLAGFGDTAAPINPESIDAELAALLEGL